MDILQATAWVLLCFIWNTTRNTCARQMKVAIRE